METTKHIGQLYNYAKGTKIKIYPKGQHGSYLEGEFNGIVATGNGEDVLLKSKKRHSLGYNIETLEDFYTEITF